MPRKTLLLLGTVLALAGPACSTDPGFTGGSCSRGKGNTKECYGDRAATSRRHSDIEVLGDANRGSLFEPLGEGPWPFSVRGVRTGHPVYASPDLAAARLGQLEPRGVAWADCRTIREVVTSYPVIRATPFWFKIKWANTTPGTGFHESEHGAKATAWVDGRQLVPIGHNGAVPTC